MKNPFALIVLVFASGFHMHALAGFLEMPDISDVPDIERRTMLRDMDVPGVRDRNPDPQAGPRLAVSAFRLQGMVEFPELGITKAELEKMVEEIRVDMMNEGKLLESGFTQDELGEVSDLLVKIEDETIDRHVSTLEVQQLVWLVRDQRSKRGITLGQIEGVADKITNFYRERGFVLAKAYIPKQEVRDGIVNLTMQLGLLGEVNAVDNVIYKNSRLESVFDDLITKPVTNNNIEERLYLINDFPGINVSGFFEPGSQVGDTRLNIKVNRENRYAGNVRVDNHGTKETGKVRLYADAYINNALGLGDYLQIGMLNSSSPSNTTYYLFRYNTKVYDPRLSLDISTSTNQFVLDQDEAAVTAALDISGDTKQSAILMDYKLKRSRASNHGIGLQLEVIESELIFGSISASQFNDKVRDKSVIYNYDLLNEEKKELHTGNMTLTSGALVDDVDEGQDNDYYIFSSDYNYLTFWKIPYFDANSRIILRTSLQLTDSALSSIEQFALAGATRARGFIANQFSADNAVYLGFEWVFNSPGIFDFEIIGSTKFSQITQPFIFADASYGVKKSIQIGEEDETAQLVDAGLGMRFSYLKNFNGNLQFAFPVNNQFTNSDITEIDDGMKVVFDFQYSFL